MFEPDFLTAEDLSDGCGDKIDVVVVSKHFEGMQARMNFMEGASCVMLSTYFVAIHRNEVAGSAACRERSPCGGDACDSRIHHEDVDARAVCKEAS